MKHIKRYVKPMGGKPRRGIRPGKQSGVMLLEVLIAILVFSLGILTVIGIQAMSIKMAADAQLRTKATLLANQLVGEMWAHGGDANALKTAFETGGTEYDKWLERVRDPNDGGRNDAGLPGVDENGDTKPTVTVDASGGATNGQVIITMFWRTPSMEAPDKHTHTVTTQITRNPGTP